MKAMAEVVIPYAGTTLGGSIGVTDAMYSLDDAAQRTQEITSQENSFPF